MLCESNLPEDFSGQRILTLLYPQDQRIPDQIALNIGLASDEKQIRKFLTKEIELNSS